MKNKHLRTVAVATLLSTVFLAGCSGSKTETAETPVTSEPVAEIAETQTVSESVLPVAEAAEANLADTTISAGHAQSGISKYDFSEGRLQIIATWSKFPSAHAVTYILQDTATDKCYMYTEYTHSGCSITPLYDSDDSVLSLKQ